MAGLSDVKAGMKLDPKLIAQILASQETADVGGNGVQRYFTDPATGQRWYGSVQNYGMNGTGDASTVDRSSVAPVDWIARDIPNPDGGKTAFWERYGLDGSFLGRGQYDRSWKDMLQAIALVAPAVGGIVGAAGGAAGTTGGAAATGASSATTGGLSAVDSLLAGGGLGAETGTLVGSSALTSGGTATLGTTIADAGIMSAAGGGGLGIVDAGVGAATSGLSTAKDVVDAGKTVNDASNATKTATDTAKTAVASNGFDQLVKLGTGVVGATLAGDALSDPVDTSRYDKLFDNLLNEQALASQRGKDLWADYTNIWKPAQQKFADTAMNYDTAGRREQAANEASGLVATEYDQKRSAATRDMQMAGVDPSTISALGAASQAWEAKDRAGAQNQARDNVEKTGLKLLKGVVDQGNTVLNQSTDQSRVATGTAGTAANVLNSQANQQNQNTQNRNAIIGDLFNAGATAYGMYTSSKKTKHVGGKVNGLAAAKAVEKSPAKKWAYKKGQGDGNTRQRMGPMAEDLKREAPQVSDGKKVDGIAQLGLHHAAIGGLSKRLERIEKKLGGLSEARRA